MRKLTVVGLLIYVSLLLVSCGNTGPLYLPGEEQEDQQQQTTQGKTGAAIWMKQ